MDFICSLFISDIIPWIQTSIWNAILLEIYVNYEKAVSLMQLFLYGNGISIEVCKVDLLRLAIYVEGEIF